MGCTSPPILRDCIGPPMWRCGAAELFEPASDTPATGNPNARHVKAFRAQVRFHCRDTNVATAVQEEYCFFCRNANTVPTAGEPTFKNKPLAMEVLETKSRGTTVEGEPPFLKHCALLETSSWFVRHVEKGV